MLRCRSILASSSSRGVSHLCSSLSLAASSASRLTRRSGSLLPATKSRECGGRARNRSSASFVSRGRSSSAVVVSLAAISLSRADRIGQDQLPQRQIIDEDERLIVPELGPDHPVEEGGDGPQVSTTCVRARRGA